MATNFGPKITAKGVADLPVRDKAYHYGLGDCLPGFSIAVNPSGSRSFHIWYRTKAGRSRRQCVGRHPQVDPMEAYRRCRDILSARDAGRDPAQELADRIAAERRDRADTLDVLVPKFLADHCAQLRSRRSIVRTFERCVVPNLPDLPVRQIVRRHVVDLIDTVKSRHGSAVARTTYAYLSVFFTWCDKRDLLDATPCRNIDVPQGKRRKRTLDDRELMMVWHGAGRLHLRAASFVRLLMISGQRRGEVAAMEWSEIAPNGLWTIPEHKMKMAAPHEVLLPRQAVAILERMPRVGKHVFASYEDKPLSTYSMIKRRLVEEMAKIDPAFAAAMPQFQLHDLRRTCRTRLGDLGVPPHVSEKVIAHVSNAIEATYDRGLYRAEKAQALQKWADALDLIVRGMPTDAKSGTAA
jgi:integrase